MASADTSRRRLVVTGANSGIGRALADHLATQGHVVVGVDRAIDALPRGVDGVECDLSDVASVAIAARMVADGGPVDGLASVAGVPGTASVTTVMQVNVLGMRRLTELLEPQIGAGGSIVLVSSMAGYRGPLDQEQAAAALALPDDALVEQVLGMGLDGAEAYQLSKQLVHRYTLELCARLHPRGVRCNSISPGPVETPILQDFRATMPTLDLAGSLVGRHARAEEIAAAAAFLLSPEASWVNGVDLRLDGGLSALRAVDTGGARRAPSTT